EHGDDGLAQRLPGDVSRIHPIEQDAAAIRRMDPLEQIDDRRLASACRTDNRDRLAGLNLEGDVTHALPRIGKLEIDVLETDVTGHIFKLAQALRLCADGDRIFQFIEGFELGAGFENLVY